MNDYQSIVGLNYSGAKVLLKSPRHYQAWLTAEQKDSPALKFGRLVHLAVLQPKAFITDVAITPDVDRRTKDGKAAYEAFTKDLKPGTEIVDAETHDEVCKIASGAEQALVSIGLKKDSMWVTETPLYRDEGGVTIKGRPDLITEIDGKKVVIDLKTTQDASPESFSRDVANYRYHLQAAFYLALTGAERFILIAQEKEAPYAWRTYELDEATLNEGKRLMTEAVALYKNCLAFNSWPSYTKDLTTISIPRYAFPQTQ